LKKTRPETGGAMVAREVARARTTPVAFNPATTGCSSTSAVRMPKSNCDSFGMTISVAASVFDEAAALAAASLGALD
ncbi:hypothetical protein OFB70_28540, partial [Escherichia coli]|nr:hypothetical protein [Escherichia coli]